MAEALRATNVPFVDASAAIKLQYAPDWESRRLRYSPARVQLVTLAVTKERTIEATFPPGFVAALPGDVTLIVAAEAATPVE
jgi:hypothetical protein